MTDFRETKIKILSEEHSRAFQEAVIAAGGEWHEDGRFPDAHKQHYLYVDNDLVLEWGVSASFFESHKYREIAFPLPVTSKNVRKDFDPAKEYSVDALESTVEEKEEVQQAFFDVDIAYEPEQQGHVHAELMAQYAEDAKTHHEPWKLWMVKDEDGVWWNCTGHPMWGNDTEYRHKPKTHIVNGVEIPDLRVSPEFGEYYYLADPTESGFTTSYVFHGDGLDSLWSNRSLCYQNTEEGKQAAILHSKAMLGLVAG